MKIQYLILVHKNPYQVERLVDALDDDDVKFIIHLDKKISTRDFNSFRISKRKNVHIIRKRFTVYWGGFNMIEATLALIREAVKERDQGYLILLSGQDYPLQSNIFISEYLKTNYGKQFLQYFKIPLDGGNMNGYLDRIEYFWFLDNVGLSNSFYLYEIQKKFGKKRAFFSGYTPFGGSQWWCITSECADFLLNFLKKNDIYKRFFQTCFVPDEMFFNTLIMNSSFNDRVVNDNLRYIDWNQGPNYPRILTDLDWTHLSNCEKLWARKFEDPQSSVINLISSKRKMQEKSILDRTSGIGLI